jgi:hypothetical protein
MTAMMLADAAGNDQHTALEKPYRVFRVDPGQNDR